MPNLREELKVITSGDASHTLISSAGGGRGGIVGAAIITMHRRYPHTKYIVSGF